jgi:hypothetical protein
MKQTAVEWLEDCLTEQHPNGSFVWNTRADLEALFKQAKEMEKQQQLELIQFLADREDFKENSSISIFIAEDYLNQFKNK